MNSSRNKTIEYMNPTENYIFTWNYKSSHKHIHTLRLGTLLLSIGISLDIISTKISLITFSHGIVLKNMLKARLVNYQVILEVVKFNLSTTNILSCSELLE